MVGPPGRRHYLSVMTTHPPPVSPKLHILRCQLAHGRRLSRALVDEHARSLQASSLATKQVHRDAFTARRNSCMRRWSWLIVIGLFALALFLAFPIGQVPHSF